MFTKTLASGSLIAIVCACSGTSTLGNGEGTGNQLTETSIRELCAGLVGCAEFGSMTECESELARTRSEARDCVDEWDAVLECALNHEGICSSKGYEVSPQCVDEVDAWNDCWGGTCDSGGGSGGASGGVQCNISCGRFAAECSGQPGSPIECVCTEGSRAGNTFSVADCQLEIHDATRAACW